jgi:DNA-binding transcriptional LysR family regulator
MMDTWDEIRTAYQVARLGTVSGAADVLGVHHATVIRHVDALEKRFGTRLFQRHARGYTPTEAGRDLMAVAEAIEAQLAQMVGRIKGLGEDIAGELLVTSIRGMEARLTPVLAAFQAEHPALVIRYASDMRLFRLDHGEAHVAIRAGTEPQEPDYVVQPFVSVPNALYATRGYLDQHGMPASVEDLAQHRFVVPDTREARAPYHVWLRDNVPETALAFRVTDPSATEAAIASGAGLGFLSVATAAGVPGLVEVMGPRPDWSAALWIVTHVDLHRTRKVQAFLTHLKAAAQGWG